MHPNPNSIGSNPIPGPCAPRVRSFTLLKILVFLLALFGAGKALPQTQASAATQATDQVELVVNSDEDADDGTCNAEHCTLREAINAANSAEERAIIQFDLPGQGAHTIAPQTALPALTTQVDIDATTQPGYSDVPLIEVNGADAGATPGFTLSTGADFSRIAGFMITDFAASGIYLNDVEFVTIEDNYIGIGPEAAPRGNLAHGVEILGSGFNFIEYNQIGANQGNGVLIEGAEAQDNLIAANYIGTNPQNLNLGNDGDGIRAINSGPQVIGGTYLIETNACCVGNRIAYNGGNGVTAAALQNVSYEKGILGNRIYLNDGLGIDLQDDGVTANDPDDSDGEGQANRLQNYPVLSAAHVNGGITISGTLTSTAETDFRIEFFANTACDESGHGEGERYLGGVRDATDAAGVVNIAQTFTTTVDSVNVGDFITATATDLSGNTSEFSACIQAQGTTPDTPGPSVYLTTLSRGE